MPPTRFKRFLFNNGVRQTLLAEKTGNTPAYISGLSLGRFSPSMEKANEIVAVLAEVTGLQVTISDLWGPETDNHVTITEARTNG